MGMGQLPETRQQRRARERQERKSRQPPQSNSTLDWQLIFGLAFATFFGLLPMSGAPVPYWLTWAGLTISFLFVIWGLLPNRDQIRRDIATLCILGVGAIGGRSVGITRQCLR